MAWDHLSINRPHLVYIILGGFTSLFMLCSSFIKERLYIGEATIATIVGVIFGPHAANLIDPGTWGNTDQITLEFSRIVLVVQCFAVGVELPKYYMEKHWRSVVFLLIPVMTVGWLLTSLFIWWMINPLDWLQSLCVAACVTATDPVLASSVVGKGKFAKRVPKHLRDVLSAESGCNDGMAFPFIYLALYLIHYKPHAKEVTFHWLVISVLYECVFGAFYGFMVGYIGRHGIKYAERHDLVDRESFLVFYFVLALFCAGSGSILGTDDLLVGFAAGVGFSNDGWFTQKTEESHVSNVIDLLINLAYFVYLGTIIPWELYNSPAIGTTPWRLVVIAIFVILFRRIPIMMALKPLIPDIKTWREALFAGHFGPIGVGAIFVAILARADLETGGTTPLSSADINKDDPNYVLIAAIWPIVTFLVISSIIVHGSSIAVFTLGKHINTLTLTMSYTVGGDDGPGWLNRLPRISSTSKSQARSLASENDSSEPKERDELPPGMLPPIGMPQEFLRRQKEEDNPSRAGSRNSSLIPRRRKKKWDDGRGPGGPISQSAIFPQRRSQSAHLSEHNSGTLTPGDSPEHGSPHNIENEKDERDLGEVQDDPEMHEILHRHSNEEKRDHHGNDADRHPGGENIYQEGDNIIIENEDGEVVAEKIASHASDRAKQLRDDIEHPSHGYKNLKKKLGVWRHKDEPDEEGPPKKGKGPVRKRGPALAYQFGNTIIVEDEDGEVVKTYELPPNKANADKKPGEGSSAVRQGVNRMSTWTGMGRRPATMSESSAAESTQEGEPSAQAHSVRQGLARMGTWGFNKHNNSPNSSKAHDGSTANADEEDDRHIRFTIGGAGRRLTKDDFLKEIQSLDPKARCEVVTSSDAPAEMKEFAKRDADGRIKGEGRLLGAKSTQIAAGKKSATGVAREMARQRGAAVDERDSVVRDRGEGNEDEDSDSPVRRRSHATSGGKTVKRMESTNDISETAAERKRREQALKGVDDVTPAQRGRTRGSIADLVGGASGGDGTLEKDNPLEESAAEKRRREAAFRGDGEEDSDDDDTPRIPPPVKEKQAKSRGIRFAESPVRGRRGGRDI